MTQTNLGVVESTSMDKTKALYAAFEKDFDHAARNKRDHGTRNG